MRILFVAVTNSIHTARWISQLNGQGWDIHLFPAEESRIHSALKNVTVHTFLNGRTPDIDRSVRLVGAWPFARGAGVAKRAVKQLAAKSWANPAWRLARTIRKLQPDIVHSMEMQHAGYLTFEARKYLNGQFPPWIYTAWGSDIFFFGQQPEHAKRIRTVLAGCDYFTADCQRDVALAKKFGFEGEVLGVFPGPGGYNIQYMQQFRQACSTSERKVIALKGFHDDKAVKGLVALQALHLCADKLSGYEIVVYSARPNVRYAAEYVARVTGRKITIMPPSQHDEILKLMGRARMAISTNISDGTPNAMLEAMVMGAFPIQSDTISTGEWIKDGENGLLVPPEKPEMVATAIRRALHDDKLVDQAAQINAQITAERIEMSVIKPQVIRMYEYVAAQGKRRSN